MEAYLPIFFIVFFAMIPVALFIIKGDLQTLLPNRRRRLLFVENI